MDLCDYENGHAQLISARYGHVNLITDCLPNKAVECTHFDTPEAYPGFWLRLVQQKTYMWILIDCLCFLMHNLLTRFVTNFC